MDPRHRKRLKTVQNLFAYSFGSSVARIPHEIDPTTQKIVKSIPQIDKAIESYAPRYPIDKISKTDLAILRLSIYELTVEKSNPPKVVINEAVELAKELSGEKSYAFVNAVLGKVIENLP